MVTQKTITQDQYDEKYYMDCMGAPDYIHNPETQQFFGVIADAVVNIYNPKTILDAGCACGHLVAALRERGVAAYGVDFSEYAISQARKDIRPYCKARSLAEDIPGEFPKKYDMIFCIEVLEHMTDQDGREAIARLTRLSDTILFSSTPFDEVEETHININPMWYWATIFSEHGFGLDMRGSCNLFNRQSMLFRRGMDYAAVINAALENKASQQNAFRKLEDLYKDKCEQARGLFEIIKNNHAVHISEVKK